MGYNLQESPENTINTMGTLLWVQPVTNIFAPKNGCLEYDPFLLS